MEMLYTPAAAARWEKRAQRSLWAMVITGAAALLGCIIMCTQVCTANAQPLLLAVIGLSTLAGWAVILLLSFAYLPARRQADHMRSMLEEETEAFEGMLTLSPMHFAIPRSIVIRKAAIRLEGEEEPVSLSVNAALADRLPRNGVCVRVLTARRYIIAVEESGVSR